jgi:DNA-binding transcriptional MerR regulator
MEQNLSIGELARRCGISVRKARFYADAGLLRPLRSEAGYRMFGEADVVRLDLILALRAAGTDLDSIGALLAGDVDLKQVLRLRLAEIELHRRALGRVAATLRMALNSENPSLADLNRVSAMITASHAERLASVERFFAAATDGAAYDPAWKARMIEVTAPPLPPEPSQEQIDAWLELSALLGSDDLRAVMRAQAADTGRTRDMLRVRDDKPAYFARYDALMAEIRTALRAGATPDSPQGQALADAYIAFCAWNRGRSNDAGFRAEMRAMWRHTDTLRRFWQLIDRLNGWPSERSAEYAFIEAATVLRLGG